MYLVGSFVRNKSIPVKPRSHHLHARSASFMISRRELWAPASTVPNPVAGAPDT